MRDEQWTNTESTERSNVLLCLNESSSIKGMIVPLNWASAVVSAVGGAPAEVGHKVSVSLSQKVSHSNSFTTTRVKFTGLLTKGRKTSKIWRFLTHHDWGYNNSFTLLDAFIYLTHYVYKNNKKITKSCHFTKYNCTELHFIDMTAQVSLNPIQKLINLHLMIAQAHYVRCDRSKSPLRWNLTLIFSSLLSSLWAPFRALMSLSRTFQSPWRRGQGLGPKGREGSGRSRCRCTSQLCPPFLLPRRSKWGWKHPPLGTEGGEEGETNRVTMKRFGRLKQNRTAPKQTPPPDLKTKVWCFSWSC